MKRRKQPVAAQTILERLDAVISRVIMLGYDEPLERLIAAAEGIVAEEERRLEEDSPWSSTKELS